MNTFLKLKHLRERTGLYYTGLKWTVSLTRVWRLVPTTYLGVVKRKNKPLEKGSGKNLQHLIILAFPESDLLGDTTAGEVTMPNQPIFARQDIPEWMLSYNRWEFIGHGLNQCKMKPGYGQVVTAHWMMQCSGSVSNSAKIETSS